MKSREAAIVRIGRIQRYLEKELNSRLTPLDLTMAQASVLSEVEQAKEKQLCLKELEKKLHLAQPVLLGTVNRLVQKQYLIRLSSSKDKRIRIVKITEAGLEKVKKAHEIMWELDHSFFEVLLNEDRENFYNSLKTIEETIYKENEENRHE